MALFAAALVMASFAALKTAGAEVATKNVLVDSLLLIGAVILFVRLPRIFRPDRTTPDVADLLAPAGRMLTIPLSRLRRLHSGHLTFYLALFFGATLVVLYLLRP
jgi:hypothetical protein